jgi:probable F420-dependent oxidoreductase
MAQRPFRFGVQAPVGASRTEWVELARTAEDLGYAVLTMPDHFKVQLAPVPALMCAADATTTLRVGALVWDNDYKHPLVLAKELATIDLLSDGRLEVGIGAGWEKVDYDQSGMAYDPPGVRVDRFVEGVTIIKGLFAEGPFTFQGTHYTVTGHEGTPKPFQRPHPPFLIGGGGKRVLSIAAREADIVGINGTMTPGQVGLEVLSTMTAAAVDEKVALVRSAAGGRLDQIEWHIRAFMTAISDDRDTRVEGIASFTGMSRDEVLASPFALIGSPAQLVEDLLVRRDRWGFSYVTISAEDMIAFAPVVAALAGK